MKSPYDKPNYDETDYMFYIWIFGFFFVFCAAFLVISIVGVNGVDKLGHTWKFGLMTVITYIPFHLVLKRFFKKSGKPRIVLVFKDGTRKFKEHKKTLAP